MVKSKKVLIPGLVLLLLAAALSAFLFFFDLNRLKPMISETVKYYTGRDLTIQGDIHLATILPPGITAENVTFQNAPWGSKPYMVRVERATIAIDLKPLFKGEFRFFNIRGEGAEVLLEFDAQGVSNFLLDVPDSPGPATIPVLAFRDIQIHNGRLTYIDHRWNANLSLQVNHLAADLPGLDKPIQAKGSGSIKGIPCTVEGHVGPITHWILPGNKQFFEVNTHLGRTTALLKGEIRDPIEVEDTSLHLTAEGPSTQELFTLAGMTAVPDFGKFSVDAELNDYSGPFALTALSVDTGSTDQVEFSINGSIKNVGALGGIDLDLKLQTQRAGNLMRLAGMPTLPVDAPLTSTVTLTDSAENQYRLENFFVTLGEQTVQGSMDLDLTQPQPVLDMELNAEHDWLGPVALATRLRGSLERISIERLNLQMGTTELIKAHVSGSAGNAYPLDDLKLTFHVFGDDLSRVQHHFQQPALVKGPFAITGQVLMADHRNVNIPEVKAILNRNSIIGALRMDLEESPPVVNGVLTANRLNLEQLLSPDVLPSGLKKELTAVGPSQLAFDISAPFSQPTLADFKLETRIRDLADIAFSGAIGDLSGMREAELYVSITGTELSNMKKLIGHDVLMQGPFALSGRIYDHDGPVYRIDNLEVSAAQNTLRGSTAIDLSGSDPVVSLDLTAEKLSTRVFPKGKLELLDRLKTRDDLGPLFIRTDLVFSKESHALRNLHLTAGEDDFIRVDIKGTVGDLPGFQKVDLIFEASGRDIASLKMVLGKPLPMRGGFAMSGRFADHAPRNFMVSNLDLAFDRNRLAGWTNLNLSGTNPIVETELRAEHFTFTPLTLEGIDPLKDIPDMGPLKLDAKLSFAGESPSIDYLDFSMGGIDTVSVMLYGTIGSLEPLGHMTLDFNIASRDLSILNSAYGTGFIGTIPIHIAGHFEDPRTDKLSLTSLDINYGDSDLSGSASLDLSKDRPALTARLSSGKLDLRSILKKILGNRQPVEEPAAKARRRRRVLSAKPYNLSFLHTLDAHLVYEGRELLLHNVAFNDVKITLELENGDLNVDPLHFNIGGGNAQGAVLLKASQNPPLADVRLTISRFDIGPMLRQLDRESTLEGSLDTTLQLTGRGNSVATLMAGLNGNVYLTIHDGRVQSQQLALLERYLGSNVLNLINPFKEQASHTKINCLINAIEVKDGYADYKLVLDTDQTALAVAGIIDLKTEKLDIAIKPSPKKGFGEQNLGYISFSLSELSQPFGLGGTLARPHLVLDPTRTIVTAGKFAGAWLLGPVGLTLFFTDISVGKKNICEETTKALQAE